MIIAIFVVPLLYFINAFFIGRFIKRFKISANPFMCTIIGFFLFFTIFYFFDIYIYTANGNIWTYLILYSIIQSILILFYIVNWKRIFITFSVDWKKIITFVSVFVLTILISWACLRDLNSQFAISWERTILNLPDPSMDNVINFRTDPNDLITNFSSLNIFDIFWINIFKIRTYNDCLIFCNWSWIICGAVIMACIATWIMPKNSSNIRLVISPLICLFYLVVILAFIESFAICDTWIMILVFVYVLTLLRKENSSSLKLFSLSVLLLSFLAMNCTSFYIVISLWIFSIYWAVRNRENSVNYFVCLTWPIIIIIFSFAALAQTWLLSFGSSLTLVIMLVVIINFSRKGSPVWTTKFARSIARNSTKVVYTFIGIILAVILVANFFIFHEVYHWQTINIDYKNFLTFTYKYIWSFELKSDLGFIIINTLLYTFFVALVVAFIVIRNLKNSPLYPIAKKDSAIKLAVATTVLFINPLVIHVLNISTSAYKISMPLNTLCLNILFVAPLFIFLLKFNFNYKLKPLTDWKYNWY